jgi:hypothetical protein
MAESMPRLSPTEWNSYTALVLRYLDGACSAEEVAQLKTTLVSHAAVRELFVAICRMHGHLHEAFAPKRTVERQRTGPAPEVARGIAHTPAALAAGENASTTVAGKATAVATEPLPPVNLPEPTGGSLPPSERETSPELPAVEVGTETIPPRPIEENTVPELPCVTDRKPPE